MERPEAHQIGELAERIFEIALPPAWACNPQYKDYGKDYVVELANSKGMLTGESFFVQLKGQKSVRSKTDGKFVTFSIETEHAAYYLDDIKDLPLFLVVVDVTREHGWWIFMQNWLRLQPTGWRRQKTITVSIPAADSIAAPERLADAVRQAKRYMRRAHPLSIEDAISAERERIRALDPRFDSAVEIVENAPVYNLKPLEPVRLRIRMTGSSERLRALYGRGESVSFEPGEISIEGSALFEEFAKTGGRLQVHAEVEGAATVTFRDYTDGALAQSVTIPGRFHCGQLEANFQGTLTAAPLSIEAGPFGSKHSRGKMRLRWIGEAWNGQKLRSLAYFDPLHRLFGSWSESVRAAVAFETLGNSIGSGEIRYDNRAEMEFFRDYLGLVHKARTLARHFNVNPIFAVESLAQCAESIEQLYAVFFEHGWEGADPGFRLTFTGIVRPLFLAVAASSTESPTQFKLETTEGWKLLNETIEPGRLSVHMSDVRLSITESNGEGVDESGADLLKISASVEGTESTIVRIDQMIP